MQDNIARNLKLLCSYAPSIAEVCRGLGVNRQQFTKYLSGASRPSARNMRRICDYFGVEETELMMPHGRFAELVSLRPRARHLLRALGPAATHIDRMIASSVDSLRPYCGYYFYYYYTPSRPGMIRRSVLRIAGYKGVYYTRLSERIQPEESPLGRSHFIRYIGVALMLGGRIFITDHNSNALRSLSQTILFPAAGEVPEFLTGMTLGVQGRSARSPFAAQVFLEYLGPQINLRPAMAQTGIFAADSAALPRHIARMLAVGGEGQHMLTALELPA
ncbi:helix-turn-helix transcriptional regulator [Rhodobacteraceae bacterium 2376]|uniref:Helix-turn-helix transcriptional regulator n=1 Tax=Rhabdonatronobacter sediminivivens TaxID=2743469 RepID=A0A7Z0I1J1_9RHOB|nr:helix-turn-helix transcriptional regulator [Rhabdonatronobacter sediminivivens]NYS25892.1 helix-turn-helix transcriptional regulator [Rhabdonatronobacter sediminivivens]